jgi:hypothetical protein
MANWKHCEDTAPMHGYKRLTIDDLDEIGVEALVGSIVRVAIEDYKDLLKRLFSDGYSFNDAIASNTLLELNNFFESEYFRALTCGFLDSDAVMEQVQKQAWLDYQESLNNKRKSKNGKNYKSKHIHHVIKEKKDA